MLKLSDVEITVKCICPKCGKKTKAVVTDHWASINTVIDSDMCIYKSELIAQCKKCTLCFPINLLR